MCVLVETNDEHSKTLQKSSEAQIENRSEPCVYLKTMWTKHMNVPVLHNCTWKIVFASDYNDYIEWK